jgi:hypothetical protein
VSSEEPLLDFTNFGMLLVEFGEGLQSRRESQYFVNCLPVLSGIIPSISFVAKDIAMIFAENIDVSLCNDADSVILRPLNRVMAAALTPRSDFEPSV